MGYKSKNRKPTSGRYSMVEIEIISKARYFRFIVLVKPR
jgi:hypothetical protein